MKERVSMVWPADLKEQVRRLAGSRGLTDFTLDAVREKLGQVNKDPNVVAPAGVSLSAPQPDRCARCHDELVSGECWTC